MMRENKFAIYFLGVCISLGLLIFVYNDYFCKSEQCYDLEVSIFGPIFFSVVGLIPTLLLLLFFSEKIFTYWVKHIAWWFGIVTFYFVASTNPYSSGVLSIDREQVALFWMAVLFIVTLVYALIMNKRLKNS